MKHCMTINTGQRMKNMGNKFNEKVILNFFSRKFKKKSDFSLNSGNSYVTLQLELCLFGS